MIYSLLLLLLLPVMMLPDGVDTDDGTDEDDDRPEPSGLGSTDLTDDVAVNDAPNDNVPDMFDGDVFGDETFDESDMDDPLLGDDFAFDDPLLPTFEDDVATDFDNGEDPAQPIIEDDDPFTGTDPDPDSVLDPVIEDDIAPVEPAAQDAAEPLPVETAATKSAESLPTSEPDAPTETETEPQTAESWALDDLMSIDPDLVLEPLDAPVVSVEAHVSPTTPEPISDAAGDTAISGSPEGAGLSEVKTDESSAFLDKTSMSDAGDAGQSSKVTEPAQDVIATSDDTGWPTQDPATTPTQTEIAPDSGFDASTPTNTDAGQLGDIDADNGVGGVVEDLASSGLGVADASASNSLENPVYEGGSEDTQVSGQGAEAVEISAILIENSDVEQPATATAAPVIPTAAMTAPNVATPGTVGQAEVTVAASDEPGSDLTPYSTNAAEGSNGAVAELEDVNEAVGNNLDETAKETSKDTMPSSLDEPENLGKDFAASSEAETNEVPDLPPEFPYAAPNISNVAEQSVLHSAATSQNAAPEVEPDEIGSSDDGSDFEQSKNGPDDTQGEDDDKHEKDKKSKGKDNPHKDKESRDDKGKDDDRKSDKGKEFEKDNRPKENKDSGKGGKPHSEVSDASTHEGTEVNGVFTFDDFDVTHDVIEIDVETDGPLDEKNVKVEIKEVDGDTEIHVDDDVVAILPDAANVTPDHIKMKIMQK